MIQSRVLLEPDHRSQEDQEMEISKISLILGVFLDFGGSFWILHFIKGFWNQNGHIMGGQKTEEN